MFTPLKKTLCETWRICEKELHTYFFPSQNGFSTFQTGVVGGAGSGVRVSGLSGVGVAACWC